MQSLTNQRELQAAAYRCELYGNLKILKNRHPFNDDLKNMISNDLFEKPNQALFIELSHYLILIIDPKKAGLVLWPIMEKKCENDYRNQLVTFCTPYFKENKVSIILASHLVTAGGFKILKFMFQLSHLALKTTIQSHKKASQELINSNKSKIEEHLIRNNSKLEYFKRNSEAAANKLIQGILETGEMQLMFKNKLTEIVESISGLSSVDKASLLNISTVPSYLKCYNEVLDKKVEKLEQKMMNFEANIKVKSSRCQTQTELIVLQHMSKDPAQYTIEYNQDEWINTSKLEQHLSSDEKFIVKNIYQNQELIFPNLIKAYVVVLSQIFKDASIGFDMNGTIERLSTYEVEFSCVQNGMKELISQLKSFSLQLEENTDTSIYNSSYQDISLRPEYNITIPEMPSLLNIEESLLGGYDSPFVPRITFKLGKHCVQPDSPKKVGSKLPIRGGVQDKTFMKTLSVLKRKMDNSTFIAPNLSLMPPPTTCKRINETVLSGGAMFSKNQIARLLSSKKSSTQKNKNNTTLAHHTMKPSKLFNETVHSGSPSLYKCFSSPNLDQLSPIKKFNLATPSIVVQSTNDLDITGLKSLSSTSSNLSGNNIEKAASLTTINTPRLTWNNDDLNISGLKQISSKPIINPIISEVRSIESESYDSLRIVTGTPTTQGGPSSKTNSLEKIIERYKKLQDSTLIINPKSLFKERCTTELENNQNVPNARTFSPIPVAEVDNKMELAFKKYSKHVPLDFSPLNTGRQSLGTILGVDHTFLDQFDLID